MHILKNKVVTKNEIKPRQNQIPKNNERHTGILSVRLLKNKRKNT